MCFYMRGYYMDNEVFSKRAHRMHSQYGKRCKRKGKSISNPIYTKDQCDNTKNVIIDLSKTRRLFHHDIRVNDHFNKTGGEPLLYTDSTDQYI